VKNKLFSKTIKRLKSNNTDENEAFLRNSILDWLIGIVYISTLKIQKLLADIDIEQL